MLQHAFLRLRFASLRQRFEYVHCVKMVGEEKGEERHRAVSFAAGTAAFVACVERALSVSLFMHWRVWAFLALNLLLLAILFTSKPQIPSDHEIPCGNGADFEIKKSKKRRNRQLRAQVTPAETQNFTEVMEPEAVSEAEADTGGIKGAVEDYDELSEEELQQRVEDFIAMFRQHLICDAKGVKIMGCTNAIAARVH